MTHMNSATVTKPEMDRDEILAHLQQILTDRRFATAERNAKFLRYVVESTLDGKANEIKETVIGIDVYGRSSNYDPKSDSIVRVEASRLRQKLRDYYENEGKHSAMRFLLPSGSYVPSFERHVQAANVEIRSLETTQEMPAVKLPPPERRSLSSNAIAAGTGLLLALAVAVLVAKESRITNSQDTEAIAAWREGTALLELDPHTAQTVSGAPKTVLRAIERFEFSVARNPLRAQSWASLAEAYDYASGFVGRDFTEDARRIDAAARRAVQLDDKLSAGHHMQGLFLKGIKWDFPRAEQSYKRALQLDPRNVYAAVEYADLLSETGRVAQAEEEIRQARALLPASPALAVKQAEIQLLMGRTEAAMMTAQSVVELKRTFMRAYVVLGMAHERQGDNEKALALYKRVLDSNPSDRRALPAYGYLLAKTGQTAQAREIVKQLQHIDATIRNCSVQVAMVYAGLAEDRLALDWLEKAWRTRQSHFPFAAVESRLRIYHQNGRFKELLDQVGLKPVSL